MSNKDCNIGSYYDEKFNRLSERTKAALRNIELECEAINDLLEGHASSSEDAE
ncbi:conserved hypothetical protein [Roseibium sp. TrichSKD4]|uniref:hypothetical protein n=1 Tax=Roseibium sp. TrichSKD4 TaxID=744980 RepID=UPI0001E56A59|nr:hypothetical protein [Roseibium sp. TrichSKD4]EFO32544.1 conserved hypothetical protein [Roseibium sp. TrichSKD4]